MGQFLAGFWLHGAIPLCPHPTVGQAQRGALSPHCLSPKSPLLRLRKPHVNCLVREGHSWEFMEVALASLGTHRLFPPPIPKVVPRHHTMVCPVPAERRLLPAQMTPSALWHNGCTRGLPVGTSTSCPGKLGLLGMRRQVSPGSSPSRRFSWCHGHGDHRPQV